MLQRILTLLLLMPAPVLSVSAAESPVVEFFWDSESSRVAAERCAEIWRQEGPALAANLLPAGMRADTVQCLIAGSDEFGRRFGAVLPDWGVGVALPSGRAVAVDHQRLPAVGRGLREVFLHEMVHALLFQGAAGAWLPSWFHEGAAMQAAGEWRFSDTVSLVLDGRVPDLNRLQGRFPQTAATADRAYRASLLAVRYLEDRHGPGAVGRVVAATAARGDFHAGFQEATGESVDSFTRGFAAGMRLRFGWLVLMTRWPSLFVLLALLLVVGAVRKLVTTRRRLATMDDPESGDLT